MSVARPTPHHLSARASAPLEGPQPLAPPIHPARCAPRCRGVARVTGLSSAVLVYSVLQASQVLGRWAPPPILGGAPPIPFFFRIAVSAAGGALAALTSCLVRAAAPRLGERAAEAVLWAAIASSILVAVFFP